MSWSTVQEGIRLAVAGALGLPDRLGANGVDMVHEVDWENRREANNEWVDDVKPIVDLILGSPRTKGTGETRYVYNPGTDKNVPTVNMYCLFTVTVRLSALTQAAGEETVGERASGLRLKLRKVPRFRDILTAANVAIVDIMETQNADELEINGRMMSVSVTELHLATTESFTDTDDSGDYIGRVQGTGELWGVNEADVRATVDLDVQS